MRRYLLAFLLLANTGWAQDDSTCPNPKKLKNLCMFVSNRAEDHEPLTKHRYVYQRRVFEAACADAGKDSAAEQARKISAMWKQNESLLVCNSLQFDVPNGSILKFAAIQFSEAFLWDAIAWGVPLNRVDESDGRTLLDYLQFQMERAKGGAIEQQLRVYYQKLREAGARHKHELMNQDSRSQ